MLQQLLPLPVHHHLRTAQVPKHAQHHLLQVGKVRPHVQCHARIVDIGVGLQLAGQRLGKEATSQRRLVVLAGELAQAEWAHKDLGVTQCLHKLGRIEPPASEDLEGRVLVPKRLDGLRRLPPVLLQQHTRARVRRAKVHHVDAALRQRLCPAWLTGKGALEGQHGGRAAAVEGVPQAHCHGNERLHFVQRGRRDLRAAPRHLYPWAFGQPGQVPWALRVATAFEQPAGQDGQLVVLVPRAARGGGIVGAEGKTVATAPQELRRSVKAEVRLLRRRWMRTWSSWSSCTCTRWAPLPVCMAIGSWSFLDMCLAGQQWLHGCACSCRIGRGGGALNGG
mmetsp:Transcript_26093/g.67107  ORF Transcript_26093/g.67107 Transcript_26093/m.67107 type:complete len:336 (-) Transcript_26093:1451-2458(-)